MVLVVITLIIWRQHINAASFAVQPTVTLAVLWLIIFGGSIGCLNLNCVAMVYSYN